MTLVKIGIVGHEAAKFTPEAEAVAREYIRHLLEQPCVVVSGRSPLGGIDAWAEEEAETAGRATEIFPPKTRYWETGYKPRNLQIAKASDRIVSIVVNAFPQGFKGLRFPYCYHCGTASHVKSGGCWTVKQGIKLGKYGWIHEIDQKEWVK